MRVSIQRTYYRETVLMLILLAARRKKDKRRGYGSKRWKKTALKQTAAGASILKVMISVACPEALMGLSAMEFYIMRSRVYPTAA